MRESTYHETPPPRRGGGILAFFIGLSILLLVGAGVFYFFIGKPAATAISSFDPLKKMAQALGTVTQEKVSVSGRSVVLEKAETRELAVVQRKTQSIVKYETEWFGSDKLLIVKGDFLVKAGFDLTKFEGFEFKGDKVVGEWPRAKILSVELLDYDVYYSKGGVINRLQGKDYEAVVNLLKHQARRDAEGGGDMLHEAEKVVHQRLEDISGQKVDLHKQ